MAEGRPEVAGWRGLGEEHPSYVWDGRQGDRGCELWSARFDLSLTCVPTAFLCFLQGGTDRYALCILRVIFTCKRDVGAWSWESGSLEGREVTAGTWRGYLGAGLLFLICVAVGQESLLSDR